MKKKISYQFTAIIVVATIIFSISGSLMIWKIFDVQKQQAIEFQNSVGKRLKYEFYLLSHELEYKFEQLHTLYNLFTLSSNEVSSVLSKLRSHKDETHKDVIDEIVLINNQGEIVSSSSRVHLSPEADVYSWKVIKEYFESPENVNLYYSAVLSDENGAPFIIFAVPLFDFQTGKLKGCLASKIRINLVWENLVNSSIGRRGIIYITDNNGQIISHPNPSIILKGVVADLNSSSYFHEDQKGEKIIRSVKNVKMGKQAFFIVMDWPVDDFFHLTKQVIITLVGLVLLFIFTSTIIVILFRKKVVDPIRTLAASAEQIMAGDLTTVASTGSENEIGLLASSLNTMTTKLTDEIAKLKSAEAALKESRSGLELQVAEKTFQLRQLLELSQDLSQNRDLKTLYRQSVESLQKMLDFDFSTLMIMRADKKSLVIEETIGFSKSTIGTLSLFESKGLSAYVVKNKKPATILNFNEENRFNISPIVFTENIKSGICVPMMIEDEVFGVFIGHTLQKREFSEDEIAICQNFANHVAIVIDNAAHLQEVYDSEHKFKELFDNNNDAILVYDSDGSLLEVNEIASERLEYTREELLNLPPHEFIAPEFAETIIERLNNVLKNNKEIFNTTHISRSGKEISVELSCTLIDYEGQRAILAIARDISERQKMEEELLKNRKLESVGVFAGGIAHDFNNILTAIIGNLNLASLKVRDKDDIHELIISAEKASFRARDLTRQLLAFSKGGEPVKEISSIAEIIQDSADFVLRGNNIKCEYGFPSDLWPVEIDAAQISQVIQNIVVNASDAMPNGGLIEVNCENVTSDVVNDLNLSVDNGNYIKISIKDRGPGIPSDYLDKIFDPYFSKKDGGSGLGLAITYSIINKHGGAILAESKPGQGTTITIYLKASPLSVIEPKPTIEPSPTIMDKRLKILVMDDDEMIRKVSKGLLSSLGYEVVCVVDGHEAIEVYGSEKFDVVIMDLTIPGGMGGEEAVKEILKLDPDAKVIVSSGYSDKPVTANYLDYGFCGFLTKPYDLIELDEALEKVLAEA